MRPRTFAREIAFQFLYREDLNPDQPGAAAVAGDALLDQGRQTRELMEFVRHLAELRDQEDAADRSRCPPTRTNSFHSGCGRRRWWSSRAC